MNVYYCKYLSLYEPTEEGKHLYMCEILMSQEVIFFKVTVIITQVYGLTVALVQCINIKYGYVYVYCK